MSCGRHTGERKNPRRAWPTIDGCSYTSQQKAGITLGIVKCEINKRSVNFLGQLVDEDRIKPDPNKVRAIQQMMPPNKVSELRRFLGMVNQQNKFSPHLADWTKPLRDLLTYSLCIESTHWNGTKICTNRERGFSRDVGLWALPGLSHRNTIHSWNRPQASCAPSLT